MLVAFRKFVPRVRNLRRGFATNLGTTNLTQANTPKDLARGDRLQFSKARLSDFGELPTGEIPEALKYDRPTTVSTLSNGIRVATEYWPGQLATVSVFIKCGSRNETIETSGTAHFLEHLHFKGTANRTRTQLELDVENMGGQLNAYTSRENTSYTMTVFKNNVPKAVEILGDMLTNSLYNTNQIEAERETIYRECIETSKDQMETLIENVHFNSYRDHMMGQPILGIRENIGVINQDMIKEFHANHYVGQNIVVVGAGDIKHETLAELVNQHFGKLPATPPAGFTPRNTEKPAFTPSIMTIRDDEMSNVNIGSFFQAPSWTDPDYYAFLLYQRILGEYTADKYTGHHLNSSDRQYNLIHNHLGNLPDVTIHKAIYAPYSDTGIFGSYFHGNEIHVFQMLYLSQIILGEYASYLNQVELFRARNKLFNELLQHETGNDITQSIGNQLLYLNRRVPRSEIATRVSNLEGAHLQRVATNWFFDNELSVVAWGPTGHMMSYSLYNRSLRRSTLGWYGDAQYYVK
jgi:processing peptidase subunit beta